MTIREQAAALGAHPSQVGRWRARGMPSELLSSRAWLAANVRRRERLTVPAFSFGTLPVHHDEDPELSADDVARVCGAVLRGLDVELATMPEGIAARLPKSYSPAIRAAVRHAAESWRTGYEARRREGFLTPP